MHWFVLHEAFASKVVIEVKYNPADVMSKNILSGEWFALMKTLIFWTWRDDSVKMRGVSLGHLLVSVIGNLRGRHTRVKHTATPS